MSFPSAPGTPPENSTANIGDDEDLEAPATVENEMAEPALNITLDQADAAGIVDAQPGDTYTLKITVASYGDTVSANIEPGSAMKVGAPKPAPRGQHTVKSPSEMGFDDKEFEPAGMPAPNEL